MRDDLDRFLDAVGAMDGETALQLVDDASQWLGTDGSITGLLAPALAEVGRRWAFGEWTVADEHAATGLVDACLSTFEPTQPDDTAPAIVLACPQDEWHVMPARLAAARLRARGWRVALLGGGQSGDALARRIEQDRPDAVGISCTMTAALSGARDLVEAAHRAGVPVLAGGAAVGGDARRADAIGADAAGQDLDALLGEARGWLDRPPSLRTGVRHHAQERARLLRARDGIVARVLPQLAATDPAAEVGGRHHVDELQTLLAHLHVALDVDDPTVLHDHVDWWTTRAVVDGVPAGAAARTIGAVAAALGPDLPVARAMLDQHADACA